MTFTMRLYPGQLSAGLDTLGDLLDGGTLKIYSGTQPAVDAGISGTILVSFTLGSPAFGAPTVDESGNCTVTLNAVSAAPAIAGGTAAFFALFKADANTWGTGTAGIGATYDMNMSSDVIALGQYVALTGFTLTWPMQGS